jgi:hypothetical protein
MPESIDVARLVKARLEDAVEGLAEHGAASAGRIRPVATSVQSIRLAVPGRGRRARWRRALNNLHLCDWGRCAVRCGGRGLSDVHDGSTL